MFRPIHTRRDDNLFECVAKPTHPLDVGNVRNQRPIYIAAGRTGGKRRPTVHVLNVIGLNGSRMLLPSVILDRNSAYRTPTALLVVQVLKVCGRYPLRLPSLLRF
jgi:hypothetical protein